MLLIQRCRDTSPHERPETHPSGGEYAACRSRTALSPTGPAVPLVIIKIAQDPHSCHACTMVPSPQPAPPYAMVVLVLLEERLMRHKVVKTAT